MNATHIEIYEGERYSSPLYVIAIIGDGSFMMLETSEDRLYGLSRAREIAATLNIELVNKLK